MHHQLPATYSNLVHSLTKCEPILQLFLSVSGGIIFLILIFIFTLPDLQVIPTLINTTIIVNLCEVQLLPLNHLNVSLIHSVLKDRISIPSTNLFCNFFLFCTIYKRHICTIFLEHCVPQQKGQFDGRRVALIQIRRDT